MLSLSCKVDTTKLEDGIRAGRKFSKRSLPKTINSALYHVAVDAQQRTPFVTPQQIDSELNAIVTPVIGMSGKALKSKKAFITGKTKYTGARARSQGKDVPLAALIIQKLAREGKSIGKGFPLSGSPFKGLPRALGAQKMAAYVDRLIKNRHRSTHFLAAGWREAIDTLRSFVQGSLRGQRGIGGQGLGSATPAIEAEKTVGEIVNNVGAEGENASSANRALWVHASPGLQAAMDHEGETRLKRAQAEEEKLLAGTVNPIWK